MLHSLLYGFQITLKMKQCTTCQHTNYHNTTNHNRYVSMAWTASIMWYILYKLAHTKILQNFWPTLYLLLNIT